MGRLLLGYAESVLQKRWLPIRVGILSVYVYKSALYACSTGCAAFVFLKTYLTLVVNTEQKETRISGRQTCQNDE